LYCPFNIVCLPWIPPELECRLVPGLTDPSLAGGRRKLDPAITRDSTQTFFKSFDKNIYYSHININILFKTAMIKYS